ncbi:hypothetical protein ABTY61_01605 [Kitasatospora sp. NPDC096128]|uniref:hypothetical protein n=1 Tax=Kitasatospora sp. NPDC096128 TaxID=3155547 RepID=UPI003331CE86
MDIQGLDEDGYIVAAAVARTPTSDRATLTVLIDGLAPWPAVEYTAVHGEKAPRP